MIETDLEKVLELEGFRRVRTGGTVDFNTANKFAKEQDFVPDSRRAQSMTFVAPLSLLDLYLRGKNPEELVLKFNKVSDGKYDVEAYIKE